MILVTGPTGSGKTVSLYTALNILNQADVNISTVEDPVEIQVAGINQVNVNLKTGLTFAEALRAFLRQDPDIVMVGEIRDLDTAEIAVKAAQTGHLVLSTLHTNDAPQSLTRSGQHGCSPLQHRLRGAADHGPAPGTAALPPLQGARAGPARGIARGGLRCRGDRTGLTIYRAVGCERCTNGYRGRVGIFQVMEVSEEMGRLIMEGGNAIQIAEQAHWKEQRICGIRTAQGQGRPSRAWKRSTG